MAEDDQFVSFGRWDAEHHALAERVRDLEHYADQRRGLEAELAALTDRLALLEEARTDEEHSSRARRDRVWTLTLLIVSGIVFPIVVTAVITFFHLRR